MFEGIDKKRGLTATATLFTAALAGYVMQNGIIPSGGAQAAPPVRVQSVLTSAVEFVAPVTPVLPAVSTAPAIEPVTKADTRPVLAVMQIPAQPDLSAPFLLTPAAITEVMTTEPSTPPVVSAPVIADAGNACDIGFTAMASPGAMVDLTLEAPCYSNQQVVISHAGLMFSDFANENGLVQVSVPALQEDAKFVATFADGHAEQADILMLTVGDYERAALTWLGETGLELHALEAGAEYGEAGHVRADAPGTPQRATLGEGGFLVLLGTDPDGHAAMVYSYPAFLTDTQSGPEISVEAEITSATCGQTVSGTFLRARPNGAPSNAALNMTIPGCDTVGEFLVLKIPAQDRRIARN